MSTRKPIRTETVCEELARPQGFYFLRIVYLVHDLNDAAVAKRVAMLKTSGLDVAVAGFWRGNRPPERIGGARAIGLAQSHDGRLLHRAWAVLRRLVVPDALRKEVSEADLILARNLEMLVLAASLRARRRVPMVYEVLDIHDLLLSRGIAGASLRTLEDLLARNIALLITSSPAFIREYFQPRGLCAKTPVLLVENKLLQSSFSPRGRSPLTPGPPWRIGWFGMIRCRKSFTILSELAGRRPDLVQVCIRGRPSPDVFPDFAADMQKTSGVVYGGPYRPEELPNLYGDTHFNWAIDYFQENGNSRWLLPNRIYEGGSFDAVPVALAGTETGRWLKEKGLGVLFREPAAELETFLEELTQDAYRDLKDTAQRAARATFVADGSECDRLAAVLTDAACDHAEKTFARSQGRNDFAPLHIDIP